jgi:hypothetical protein
MSILHVTNGDSARVLMERSGVPGTFIAWPDLLHEGPTPLVSGEEWRQVRSRYLVSQAYGDPGASVEEMLHRYREGDAALDSYSRHDELVLWFEHDLFDQLLLIRHLWWLGAANGAKGAEGAKGAKGAAAEGATTRLSLVCGEQYLGLLRPEEFPVLFAARKPITANQARIGTRVWEAFCAPDPMGLLAFSAAERPPADDADDADDAEMPYLSGAIRRHLEEFPWAANGLARSERQILQVLSEGLRTPEEAFVEASRLEDRIFMGDLSFGTILRRLAGCPRPLIAADVQPRPGRLPTGTLALTHDGAAVLAGRADHVALNGVDRWLGGARLTSGSCWRWDDGRQTLVGVEC